MASSVFIFPGLFSYDASGNIIFPGNIQLGSSATFVNGSRLYRLTNNGTNFLLETSNGGAFSTVGTFTSGGAFTAPGTASVLDVLISGGTGYVAWAGRGELRSAADGNVRVQNGAGTNTYDMTVADWGITRSAEGINIPDTNILSLMATGLGILMISVGTDNNIGIFALTNNGAPVIISDPGNLFSIIKDTASKLNLYFESGYKLQNLRGGARIVRISNDGS